MRRVLGLALSAHKTCVRRISVTTVRPDLARVKKNQARFQAPGDEPVYIKGGPLDYVLYYTTVVLTFVGLGGSFHSAYKLTKRK